MVGTRSVQPSVWPHAPCTGCTPREELVSGTLSTWTTGQGPRVVPEASQVLRPQRAAHASGEVDDKEEPVPSAQGDEVLPNDALGLVEAGLQVCRQGYNMLNLLIHRKVRRLLAPVLSNEIDRFVL